MGLRLQPVAPTRGWNWLRQGLRLWLQRPLAFVGLFVFFLFAVLLLMVVVPVLGGPLGMALLPMLSLGFMIASRSALAGGPVHILQLAEGLRHPERSQRRAQWTLCAAYAAGTILVITLADWVDGGSFEALQREMAAASADGKPSAKLDAILADPRLVQGMLVRLGLAGLLSVPFWHAPALVHWGGQGALQALFSSTLALWRTRGAFTLYLLGWAGAMVVTGMVFSVVAALTGANQLLGLMTLPIGLAFSAAFYASLWFSFDDTFGAGASGPDRATQPPA
ncbi:MAG: BPSS1780 family membrane protein [Aquabacterium sp.]|nr:BPSS1780 family membrane protein [Aquabacterium sp.]